MVATSPFELLLLLVFSIVLSDRFCNGSDTISTGQSLSTNQTIVSKLGKFELGFFSPGSSSNHYVGIWYKNIPIQTVVWVANRNYPISPSYYNSSRLEMSNNNLNLIVNSVTIWTLKGSSNASEAAILDTGNFVLRNVSGVEWQSFDHPSGTWLPGGVIGLLESETKLVSWRNGDDPGTGNYSLGMERNGGSEVFLKKNGSETIWRSGVMKNTDLYNFSYVRIKNADFLRYDVYNESTIVRIVLHSGGLLYHYVWSEARRDWFTLAVEPSDPDFCRNYEGCGANAICDVNYSPACRCLEGFVPRVKRDWDLFDFSNGCVREKALQCEKEKTMFMKVSYARSWRGSPESRNVSSNGECESFCLTDCLCSAYANSSGDGCLLFKGELLDLERLQNDSLGDDLYIRMESSSIVSGKGRRKVVAVALAVPIAAAVVVLCFCFCYLWPKLKRKFFRGEHQDLLLLNLNPNGGVEEKQRQYELPVFSFSSIVMATNNFSDTNKLGEGGFGPVYKGELLNGMFVAVKRLSSSSGQGLEEFRNETELIAKLQHRNLVGILGCCTENDENILVYEYMPNKSLDFFLFESNKKDLLDWKKRVRIIEGIAQGLLYLHNYSRLRIVHRDLKASNILLDAEMNPKISDFGMARIFGGNDLQANTKRIVGTYGYMSPEYAMKGIFSVKSDVYSFGVLMLEIISGKTISSLYGSDHLSLLEYAWNMWKQERALELVDPVLEIPASSPSAQLRYIQIGLLCVQENPADRPLMSDAVGMLNNEETAIAAPQHPAFSVGSTSRVEICSVNELTVSQVEAR
ncbi:hypothetical protein C2S52_013584 [Perilla frutescens var. hirtella]|nr:hypothetical protein C2S51_015868 [Perilla frutescens var. frutescens]KAH6776023.1 hypothetical protein C2S52_013584 [Perilla frutescens var. hirtella]